MVTAVGKIMSMLIAKREWDVPALVIHPTLKERSSTLAEPASDIKTCDHYQQFPLYLAGERHEHYGIPHGFSSRVALERYLNGLFGEAS